MLFFVLIWRKKYVIKVRQNNFLDKWWLYESVVHKQVSKSKASTYYPTSSWSLQPGLTSKKTRISQTYSQSEIGLLFLSALIGSSLGLLYNTLALCNLTGLPAFELQESIKTINTHRNKAKEGSSCKNENCFWISMQPLNILVYNFIIFNRLSKLWKCYVRGLNKHLKYQLTFFSL